MLDTVGLQKVEEKSKQSFIKKIIYGVNFNNPYLIEIEKKTEIIETIESNYPIARRVYQQLYIDISELFVDFIRSMDSFEIHDIDNDIKANGWGIKKITDVNDAEGFMTIFQTFYQITGRLPLSNGLLIYPDGEAPPGADRVNMKNLYELFRQLMVWFLCHS